MSRLTRSLPDYPVSKVYLKRGPRRAGAHGWSSFTPSSLGICWCRRERPEMKLRFESDPGLIFSVGFDAKIRIDIEPGELSGDGSDGERDISFYYLFSSIRMYSIQLPRQQRGQIGLSDSRFVLLTGRSSGRAGQQRNRLSARPLWAESTSRPSQSLVS